MKSKNLKRALVLIAIIIIVIVIGIVTNCSDSSEVRPRPIDFVRVVQQTDTEITFIAGGDWSSTCGKLAYFDVEKEGYNYTIRMFGKWTDGFCGSAVIEISGEITIKVPEPGLYHFSFCDEYSYKELTGEFPNICSWDILMGEEPEEFVSNE